MLVPAQLYREELKNKMIACWYEPKYKYYFSGEYNEIKIADNAYWRRDFVHLNSKGEVDGYFCHNYNDACKSMNGFGLISFSDSGALLVREVIEYIMKMFEVEAQRAEFFAFADNPAVKLYDKLIKRYGGKFIGRLTRSAYFCGEYHDCVFYEILKEDLHGINKSGRSDSSG